MKFQINKLDSNTQTFISIYIGIYMRMIKQNNIAEILQLKHLKRFEMLENS